MITDISTRDWEHLLISRAGEILIVTMNRPERLNAVDLVLHEELTTCFKLLDHDRDSRVVLLTGSGRAFCSGGDVKRMATSGAGAIEDDETVTVHSKGWHLVNALLSVEKPIIAAVNGPAVGLGATIALLCDVVIMAEDARIGDRHVNVGLVAGDGGAVVWPLLVGPLKAKELLMTGRLIDGREAAQIGLVNKAVPLDELHSTSMELAEELGSLPPYAVRATKHSVNRYVRWMAHEVLDTSLAWEHLSMAMDDHLEASRAFVDKRKGVYKGR